MSGNCVERVLSVCFMLILIGKDIAMFFPALFVIIGGEKVDTLVWITFVEACISLLINPKDLIMIIYMMVRGGKRNREEWKLRSLDEFIEWLNERYKTLPDPKETAMEEPGAAV